MSAYMGHSIVYVEVFIARWVVPYVQHVVAKGTIKQSKHPPARVVRTAGRGRYFDPRPTRNALQLLCSFEF